MEAAITLAALPVASVVLWTLLRSPSLGGRLVAVPTGARWHDRATPLFGGVGIAAGLVTGVLLAVAAGVIEPTWLLAGIVGGCGIVFGAGLLDDVRHLSPIAKLVAQFAAAAIVIAAGLRVELVSNDVVGVVIALVWLVGITNAFNLLDNMDGLAATLATVACAYFAIDASTVHENDLVLVLALSLAFACLGFLPFNLRPGDRARVFMGDSGSQLLGFLLAALGLAASWTTAGTTIATMLLPLLVLAIPILDTTLVTVRAAGRATPGHAGREGPHVAPARLLRPLGDARGRTPRPHRHRARRDGRRVQRARPAGRDGARDARHVRPARAVRQASSPSFPRTSALAAPATRPSATRSRCSRDG